MGDRVMRFAEETDAGAAVTAYAPKAWRVLLVDDEHDVHLATKFALADAVIEHRPLEFLHAYSAAEARTLLAREKNVAVVLLDVVMETEHAGLDLVRVIRGELGLADIRIVLRTGQPGYAPEIEAIRDYDINDYQTKGELNRTRLYTTLTAAIRGYEQLRVINASRRGLELIVRGSAELLAADGMRNFAAGVIVQLSGLLGIPPEGLFCAHLDPDATGEPPRVLAAAGRYAHLTATALSELGDERVRSGLARCLSGGESRFEDGCSVLYFEGRRSGSAAVFLDTPHVPDEVDRQLIEVFVSSIAAGFENIALFARLEKAAFHDTLVALPNRNGLLEHLAGLSASERALATLAVVDIDEFADLNGALGQHYGDRLLQQVARRLVGAFGAGRVARIGSDQFAVLGDGDVTLAPRIHALFADPFEVDADRIRVSVSLGLARLHASPGEQEDALTQASLALDSAKSDRLQARTAEYSPTMVNAIRHRVGLLQRLREALTRDELRVAYQPQVLIDGGRPVGLEALARWRPADGADVSPAEFIPLAERAGLIEAIGGRVFETALRDLKRLHGLGFGDLRVAVNISAIQVCRADFAATVGRLLDAGGVPPGCVELEVTESVAMGRLDVVQGALRAVKDLGASIALDDFGTGFSSLAYLHRLPVDRLKIDRAFVAGLAGAGEDGGIARTIVELARTLGLSVIAEGVERPEQGDILAAMGCREAQGYLFAHPMYFDELLAWLVRRTPAASGGVR